MKQHNVDIFKAEKSRLPETSLENIPFGRTFTDHMLMADYEKGGWGNVMIMPYQPLSHEPSLAAIHYGQSIFEGIKAYHTGLPEPVIFRPYDNFNRFNDSAKRMQMPSVPEEIFIEGMKELIKLDKDWIPPYEGHSLYIRPFMFATDAFIGVRPSSSYTFMIILSPTGPYYSKPLRIAVEEKYTRTAPGGVGQTKNAGNYGASLKPTEDARQCGFDQVLWTDAFEHKWLQEVGTMNVFFVLKDKIITPSLEEGTILDGITRRSVITVLRDEGFNVEERRISINELIHAYKNDILIEAFGTGTAATISPIRELAYKNIRLLLDVGNNSRISNIARNRLDAIRSGKAGDKYGWIMKI